MVGQVSECIYCGQAILRAADGAWEGVSGGACGCSASLEQGGDGEHEVASRSRNDLAAGVARREWHGYDGQDPPETEVA